MSNVSTFSRDLSRMFGLNFGLDLSFAVLDYFQKSWLDLTFVDITFVILWNRIFRVMSMDITFACICQSYVRGHNVCMHLLKLCPWT